MVGDDGRERVGAGGESKAGAEGEGAIDVAAAAAAAAAASALGKATGVPPSFLRPRTTSLKLPGGLLYTRSSMAAIPPANELVRLSTG